MKIAITFDFLANFFKDKILIKKDILIFLNY